MRIFTASEPDALKSLRSFIDMILFGNIYVALGAVCLVQSTRIQLGYTDPLFFYSLLVFFATIFIYNFQRIFYRKQEDISLHSVRRKWIFRHQRTIRTLSVLGFTGVCVTFFYNDPKILFYLSPLLLVSIAYFVPFIRLRRNPWFKLLTLALVWTTVTAIVPVLLGPITLTAPENLLHITIRFCFMMAICIPFDIRDVEIDKADDISTLPHLLGLNRTRWLAVGFMFIYILLLLPEYALDMFDVKVATALFISAFINTIFVFLSSPQRNEYFFVAGLDGTMILQGALLMLASEIPL